MSEIQLNLTAQERQYLAEFLEWELKETRVEEHHTRTPSFREQVVLREDVIRGLLAKLAAAEAATVQAGV